MEFGKEDYYIINKRYERYGKKKEPTIQDLQKETNDINFQNKELRQKNNK